MEKPRQLIRQDFEETFRQETSDLIVERARVLIGTGVLLFLSFWFLDYFVAGEHAGKFLLIRVSVAALNAAILASLYSSAARRFGTTLVVVGATAAGLSIAFMTTFLGGFASTYFVGIMIVIVAVPLIAPIGIWPTLAMSIVIVFCYVGFNLPTYGASRDMAPPLFFLLGMTAFSCIATSSQVRTRRRDLSLRLRLESANRELKELDAAKTRLFANVSHELRTPLTLILGPLQALLKAEHEPRKRQSLEAMSKSARRLLRQVDTLLDVAKLQSGQLRLVPRLGELGDLLKELVVAARPHAATRGIEIVDENLDALPTFPFDSDKVEMIAANLISNALKFTLPGGTVRVRGSSSEERVVFEVSDNGIGIAKDQHKQIFDRFHQVDDSSSRIREGTGLGLALAKELAQLHGGDISVTSEIDVGSTFRVEIPLKPPSQQIDRRQKPRRRQDQMSLARMEAIKAHEFANRSRRSTLLADIVAPGTPVASVQIAAVRDSSHLLIVDDNVDLRNMLAQELSQSYSVTTACDGEQALEKLSQNSFDLVVSDVMMPVMDGYELCQRIREHPRLRSLPVILVTAKAGEEAVVEGLEVGADDYVTKPFDMRELSARINAHLRAKQVESKLFERDTRLSAIGRMTAGLVNDLRNPLTLIKGHADLAQHFAQQDDGLEQINVEIENVLRATDRLRQRMEEILDYSRGGTPDLQTRELGARSLLDEILPPLLDELSSWGIRFDYDNSASEESMLLGDRGRLDRVFENLISHARESVRNTEIKKIQVVGSTENHRLVVAVADSGPNADPNEDLFVPSVDGNGVRSLALATVKNLVRAHGGAVETSSDPTQDGKVVRVFLPLISQELAADDSAHPPEG